MTIDIRGTSTVNKGAQLMLEAVAERLSPHFALSAPPVTTDYSVRAHLGLQQTLHEFRFPRVGATLGNAVPSWFKVRYGLVSDADLTGIVDASGFAYSDSFSLERIRREALYGVAWARRGVPKVLLPQAFGPFNDGRKRAYSRMVIEQSRLVFARDKQSADYVRSLGVTAGVEVMPDFTIGLVADAVDLTHLGAFGAIVPNGKMVSTGVLTQESYTESLLSYVDAVAAEGLQPVFVVHEATDRAVLDPVLGERDVPVLADPAPRKLKGMIGQAQLVVGSRFHALVGALSQGVPTVALGWSHKYAALMEDFGVSDWLSGPDALPADTVRGALRDLAGQQRLRERKALLAEQTEKMWESVIGVLGAGS
jgi:colanic acid/amylovoran biosynthesis protein